MDVGGERGTTEGEGEHNWIRRHCWFQGQTLLSFTSYCCVFCLHAYMCNRCKLGPCHIIFSPAHFTKFTHTLWCAV